MTGGVWVRELAGAENRILLQAGQWKGVYCKALLGGEGQKPSEKVSGTLSLEPQGLFSADLFTHLLHSPLSFSAPSSPGLTQHRLRQAHADLLSLVSLQCSGETQVGPGISPGEPVAMPDKINGSSGGGENAGGANMAT